MTDVVRYLEHLVRDWENPIEDTASTVAECAEDVRVLLDRLKAKR